MKEAAVYDGKEWQDEKGFLTFNLPHFIGKTKPGEKKDTSKALPDAYSPKYVEVRWSIYFYFGDKKTN